MIHKSAEYLKDLEDLKGYILSELNVQKFTVTSDEVCIFFQEFSFLFPGRIPADLRSRWCITASCRTWTRSGRSCERIAPPSALPSKVCHCFSLSVVHFKKKKVLIVAQRCLKKM